MESIGTNVVSSTTGKTIVAPKQLSQEEILASLGAAPTMLDVPDLDVEHVQIFGGPGTGKTTLAGLMAEFFHILWFDGDKGLKALQSNLPQELLKRIIPIRIPDNTQYPIFVATMLRVITGRQVDICIEHGIVGCGVCKAASAQQITVALNKLPKNWIVVMDSMTQFKASCIAQIMHKLGMLEMGDTDDNARFDWQNNGWSMLSNRIEKFGNYIKDLECDFISISHETMAQQEDKSNKLVATAGSDPSSRSFAKYFGTQVYSQIVNNRHHFASSSTYANNIQTKSRANVALEKMKVPSLIHVFRPKEAEELLKGSFNEWFFSDRKGPQPKPKEIISV